MKMEGKTSIKVDVKLNVPDETAAACAVILGFYLDEHPEKTVRDDRITRLAVIF